jgi:hypothetical protein
MLHCFAFFVLVINEIAISERSLRSCVPQQEDPRRLPLECSAASCQEIQDLIVVIKVLSGPYDSIETEAGAGIGHR